jgi:hypothetical protein
MVIFNEQYGNTANLILPLKIINMNKFLIKGMAFLIFRIVCSQQTVNAQISIIQDYKN